MKQVENIFEWTGCPIISKSCNRYTINVVNQNILQIISIYIYILFNSLYIYYANKFFPSSFFFKFKILSDTRLPKIVSIGYQFFSESNFPPTILIERSSPSKLKFPASNLCTFAFSTFSPFSLASTPDFLIYNTKNKRISHPLKTSHRTLFIT